MLPFRPGQAAVITPALSGESYPRAPWMNSRGGAWRPVRHGRI